jgi:hypothetical protein
VRNARGASIAGGSTSSVLLCPIACRRERAMPTMYATSPLSDPARRFLRAGTSRVRGALMRAAPTGAVKREA